LSSEPSRTLQRKRNTKQRPTYGHREAKGCYRNFYVFRTWSRFNSNNIMITLTSLHSLENSRFATFYVILDISGTHYAQVKGELHKLTENTFENKIRKTNYLENILTFLSTPDQYTF